VSNNLDMPPIESLKRRMPAMFADLFPGAATAIVILFTGGIICVFCLIGAGLLALMKCGRAAAGLMITAGVCIGVAIIIIGVELCLAKAHGWP
jgi:hypothetical protein